MKLCPECLTPLTFRRHKIFECWHCPEGHGTYYPKGELEKIVRAVSGLGDLEVKIWQDHESYSVVESPLLSPESNVPMLEIRDAQHKTIMVYGDPITHDLWVHTGEEEKLVEQLEREARVDAVSTYLWLAAKEAAKIFDDDEPLGETAGHLLVSLKLLGERLLRAMPTITI